MSKPTQIHMNFEGVASGSVTISLDANTVTRATFTKMASSLFDQYRALASLQPAPNPKTEVKDYADNAIKLTSIGPNVISVIKGIREITGLGLKEAKDVVDLLRGGQQPFSIIPILQHQSRDPRTPVEWALSVLQAAGATVERCTKAELAATENQ